MDYTPLMEQQVNAPGYDGNPTLQPTEHPTLEHHTFGVTALLRAQEYHQLETNLPKWRQYYVRSRREIKVIHSRVNKRVLQQIVGPMESFLKPADPLSEWALIRGYFRNFNVLKILKMVMLSVGSVICPLLGVFLLFFARFTTVSMGHVGDEYREADYKGDINRNYYSRMFVMRKKGSPLSCSTEMPPPQRRRSLADVSDSLKTYLSKLEAAYDSGNEEKGEKKGEKKVPFRKRAMSFSRPGFLFPHHPHLHSHSHGHNPIPTISEEGSEHTPLLRPRMAPGPIYQSSCAPDAPASPKLPSKRMQVDMPKPSEDDERWIFVNGMCCDRDLTWTNALHLSRIFRKRISMFHNPTQGAVCDLVECFLGRTYFGLVENTVAQRLRDVLVMELHEHNHDKVVLCVHSQGSIIASNAISLIIKENSLDIALKMLRKLEVYTFGCAADEFDVVRDASGMHYPYYEHFANTQDFVAEVGVLSWPLPGNILTGDFEGHMLGEHYLPYLEKQLYQSTSGMPSRLYTYLPDVASTHIPSSAPTGDNVDTAVDVLNALGGKELGSGGKGIVQPAAQ